MAFSAAFAIIGIVLLTAVIPPGLRPMTVPADRRVHARRAIAARRIFRDRTGD